jgi:hypothetical protein
MILYDLRCGNDHIFEAWFADSLSFESQAKAGHVECPLCGDATVVRAPMAPNISTGSTAAGADSDSIAEATKVLTNVRDLIENHCENVGNQFPEEARKIHYGESRKRNIFGEATLKDAAELREEGIEFGELPRLPRRNS